MPNYTFMTPELQALLQAIDNAKQQQPQTPADYVTDQTIQGNDAQNAAFAQQQQAAAQAQAQAQIQQLQAQMPQQEPLLNPMTKAILDQLNDYKYSYENADAITKAANPKVTDAAQLGAAADSLRLSSHKAADEIRQLAAGLGVDLTGYENVGYEDAAKKLQSREAKELMDITTGQGKYGRSSARYFDDEYMMLIGEGKSAREARRLAGQLAQRYQDDRVTYLRNAYNMYGRDGNYTNEDGLGILGQIAIENPGVANIYAQAYQLPTDLQNRLNALEDKDIDQRNALAQINASGSVNSNLQREQHGYNLEKLMAEIAGDIEKIRVGGEVTRANDSHRHGLDMELELRKSELRSNEFLKEQNILNAGEEDKLSRQVKGIFRAAYLTARGAGASEEEATKFANIKALELFNNPPSGTGRSGNGSKTQEPKYTDKQNVYLNNMANLMNQARADPTNAGLLDELDAKFKGDDLGINGESPVKASDFDVATYQDMEDRLNALRGMYHKMRADDNKATEYWAKVRNVQLLKDWYPNENWDWYWARRGGKPQSKKENAK